MGVVAKQIVLIGPDCSGKSTLAKLLSEHYNIPLKANRRIKDDLDAVDAVLDFVREEIRNGESFILDQWQYPVDIVYNRSLRNCPSPVEYIKPLIDPVLEMHHVLFIHIDCDEEELRKRFASRGDELWDIEQIVKVAQAYRDFFHVWDITAKHLDTTYLTPREVLGLATYMVEKHYGGDLK